MRKVFKALTLLLFIVLLSLPNQTIASTEDFYIVTFKDGIDEELILETEVEIVDRLKNSPIMTVYGDEKSIEKIRQAESVRAVEKDKEMAPAAQQVGWGFQVSKVPHAWNNGYTGKGVKIAIVDSGVGPHKDLNVVKSITFIQNEKSTDDRNGHGTHIAGIIGALDNDIGVKGVAPEADLYSLKVFDKDGIGLTTSVIKAIDWSIENDMDIINLSLTSKVGSTAYEEILNRAYAEGILIVAASGNSIETNPLIDNVEYPAKYNSVIAVSAINHNYEKGYYSSIGPANEITAPGESIYSTYLNNGYKHQSGTSLATAFISGQLALIKEAYPSLTNTQIRKKMVDDAIDLGVKGRDSIYGYGLLESKTYTEPLYAYPAKNNQVVNLIIPKETVSGETGDTIDLQLIAKFQNGQEVNVSRFVEWETTDHSIASVKGRGLYLLEAGETYLVAKYGNHQKEIPVIVQQPNPSNEQKLLPFYDLNPSYWAYDEVRDIYNRLIITGYDDRTFRPGMPIHRQHVAVMMNRAVSLEEKIEFSPFPDVTMRSPYFYEIAKMQQAGIFSGNENGFQPDQSLSRAQMSKVIAETFHLPKAKKHPFPDVSSNHWANDYIAALYEAGITTGSNGEYQPNRHVTRAEFVVFMHRALNWSQNQY